MLQRVTRMLALLIGLAACSVSPPPPEAPPAPGSVRLNQHTMNDHAGGQGTGSVYFEGTLYHFAASGLGVGGSAVALMQLTGDVSNLGSMRQFPGAYRALPGRQSGNELWLRNEYGVVLHLVAPPGSRMPQLGEDGIQIRLDV